MCQVRKCKVDPDTALNDEHEERRTHNGAEGKNQDDENKGDGEQIDEQRIAVEGVRQLLGARHVADDEARFFSVASVSLLEVGQVGER